MGTHPRPARDPRQRRRDRRPNLRREIPLAGVGARAALHRVYLERLEDLPLIVAFTPAAPTERHVIAVDRPRAGYVDSGFDGGLPASLPGEMRVVVLVLLAIAIGMAVAHRDPATPLRFPIGGRNVRPNPPAPAVREAPGPLRGGARRDIGAFGRTG